jgi:hypothetical protein
MPHLPSPGSVVIYHSTPDRDHERYRIGTVIGPVVREPVSGALWVGVRLSRRAVAAARLDFIDVASIVHMSPPADERAN